MAVAIEVIRAEQAPQEPWRIAADQKAPGQARKVHPISLVLDGWSRGKAAAFADVGRQTLKRCAIGSSTSTRVVSLRPNAHIARKTALADAEPGRGTVQHQRPETHDVRWTPARCRITPPG